MQHDDMVYAGTMLDTALRIRRRAANLTRGAFDAHEDVQLALTHLIQVFGEAAMRTSPPFRAAHPQIPWAKVIGMRHRIVHNYDDVNADIIWDVATAQLEPVIVALQKIVPE
jgi:uncharacterized protein with HEPN domain